jgi:2-oxoglutarate ferredoxin oxidoreductase subunit beta
LHDNGNYALTTGQASATTPQGAPRTANPDGPTASTLNPVDLALSLKPSFVARAFSGEIKHMTEVIKQGILHQKHGFAYVNILQSCPTYNRETTQNWYYDRIKDISTFADYDETNLAQARNAATLGDEIAIGVLYKNLDRRTYLERLEYRHEGSWKDTNLVDEVARQDVTNLLSEFV